MAERRCRNCANFEEEERNFWTCSAGEFKNEPGDEVRESEPWNHCGRKYKPEGKMYESKFYQYLEESSKEELHKEMDDLFKSKKGCGKCESSWKEFNFCTRCGKDRPIKEKK